MSIRVRITDDKALSNVNCTNLANYLKRRGWSLGWTGVHSEGYYLCPPGGGAFEIVIPKNATFDGNVHLMYKNFQILEEVENRSQLDIWEDLK